MDFFCILMWIIIYDCKISNEFIEIGNKRYVCNMNLLDIVFFKFVMFLLYFCYYLVL